MDTSKGNLMTQSRGKRRTYTDKQKADALALYDALKSPTKAAKNFGFPVRTVEKWIKYRENIPIEAREEAKKDLLTELDKARWKYLNRLSDDAVVNKESGYYASQSFKILNEQHQLLSGGPTQRFSLAEYLRTAITTEGEFKELPQGEKDGQHPQPQEHDGSKAGLSEGNQPVQQQDGSSPR